MDEILRRLIEETSAETHRRFDEAVGELRQEMRVVTTDLRRHFDVTAENFRHQVQLVASRT